MAHLNPCVIGSATNETAANVNSDIVELLDAITNGILGQRDTKSRIEEKLQFVMIDPYPLPEITPRKNHQATPLNLKLMSILEAVDENSRDLDDLCNRIGL